MTRQALPGQETERDDEQPAGLVPLDAPAPLAYSIADAGKTCGGLSTATMNKLIADGELEVVTIGDRTIVPRDALLALLARNRRQGFDPAKRAEMSLRRMGIKTSASRQEPAPG